MARKRRRFGARPEKAVFVLACEDSKSAPGYFKVLFRLYSEVVSLQLATKNANRTSPDQVVDRAREKRDSIDSYDSDRDQTWAVFDAEPQNQSHKQKIDLASTSAVKANVEVAVSNPCFEHWLSLHLGDCDGGYGSSEEASKAFAKAWEEATGNPYGKGRADFSRIASLECVTKACERAKKQHDRQDGKRPDKCRPCVTDVYKLVLALKALKDPDSTNGG